MTKDELIKLKEKLLLSKKYRIAYIEGNEDGTLTIEYFDEKPSLSENIKLYDENEDRRAADYLENSVEEIVRKLADEEISYDEIEVGILPLFYISESLLKEKLDEDGIMKEEDLTEYDIIRDKAKIIYDFNINKDGKPATLNNDILLMLDELVSKCFSVDYETFVEMMCESGYEINASSFAKALKYRKENKNIGLNIEFPKNRVLNKNK